jgi:hypothetical protein
MIETAQILVRDDVDLKTFDEEIDPAAQSVFMKGLVRDRPRVDIQRIPSKELAAHADARNSLL